MNVFGVILLSGAFIALVHLIRTDYKRRDGFSVGIGVFMLMLIAFFVGICVKENINNSYNETLEIFTTPDTLIVTGYVLQIDTVKAGE